MPDWFTRTARGGVLRLSRLVSSLKFVKLERCALICFFAVGSETCAACGAILPEIGQIMSFAAGLFFIDKSGK